MLKHYKAWLLLGTTNGTLYLEHGRMSIWNIGTASDYALAHGIGLHGLLAKG